MRVCWLPFERVSDQRTVGEHNSGCYIVHLQSCTLDLIPGFFFIRKSRVHINFITGMPVKMMKYMLRSVVYEKGGAEHPRSNPSNMAAPRPFHDTPMTESKLSTLLLVRMITTLMISNFLFLLLFFQILCHCSRAQSLYLQKH